MGGDVCAGLLKPCCYSCVDTVHEQFNRYEIVGVSDNLDSLCYGMHYSSYVVIMDLEMMRVATPHIGVEPCAGPKTDVPGNVFNFFTNFLIKLYSL